MVANITRTNTQNIEAERINAFRSEIRGFRKRRTASYAALAGSGSVFGYGLHSFMYNHGPISLVFTLSALAMSAAATCIGVFNSDIRKAQASLARMRRN